MESEKKSSFEEAIFYVLLIILTLVSFMCGFHICETTLTKRSQGQSTTPKVQVIPRSNGALQAPDEYKNVSA